MFKVAIITRTRNREQLLSRCMRSVVGQSYKNFQWILVNDAGERSSVDRIAEQARRSGANVLVVHRTISSGMEAAANEGVRSSNSEFVAIHDDDDTWEPEFLARTISFLEHTELAGGVVTHCNRIMEKLKNGQIKQVKSTRHLPILFSVQLADMSCSNLFPPIAFVYRRSMFDLLGGYDEKMPILGDWDFNLRFLLRGDILVLPENLANYHVRTDCSAGDPLSNSIRPGSSRQSSADALFRNRMLRGDIEDGRIGIGFLLFLGHLSNSSKNKSWFRSSLIGLKRFLWQ